MDSHYSTKTSVKLGDLNQDSVSPWAPRRRRLRAEPALPGTRRERQVPDGSQQTKERWQLQLQGFFQTIFTTPYLYGHGFRGSSESRTARRDRGNLVPKQFVISPGVTKRERGKRYMQRSLQLFIWSHKACGRNNQNKSSTLLRIIGLKAIKKIRSISKKRSEPGTATAREAEANWRKLQKTGSLSPGMPGSAPSCKCIWMDKQHTDCRLMQEKDLISPKEISQRRLVRSSPADTFYNLIDRAYFLLKTSQVGLTHAELTSILAGWGSAILLELCHKIRSAKQTQRESFRFTGKVAVKNPALHFYQEASLKCKHGSVESLMQIPGWGKRKISSPPSSAKMKCWQRRHLECQWLFLSWSLQCRWRSPSQQAVRRPGYFIVPSSSRKGMSSLQSSYHVGIPSPTRMCCCGSLGFYNHLRNQAASTAEYDLFCSWVPGLLRDDSLHMTGGKRTRREEENLTRVLLNGVRMNWTALLLTCWDYA